MKSRFSVPKSAIIAGSLFFAALATEEIAGAQIKSKEFHDKQYGYSLQYPAGWRLIPRPEGEANPNVRFVLQGIEGSSFMVVVEPREEKTVKQESAEKQKELVAQLMTQTIEQIYRRITLNLKATVMTVGERRDLSNEIGHKFYIATLHKMPTGKPIIVAGIHALPFGKNYSINFIMNAFWDGEAGDGEKVLLGVFNSFHLAGEAPNSDKTHKPDAGGKVE